MLTFTAATERARGAAWAVLIAHGADPSVARFMGKTPAGDRWRMAVVVGEDVRRALGEIEGIEVEGE